ncbi:MAG: response regulator transcription factor, partial [Erysipelotrichaceae bacterium]
MNILIVDDDQLVCSSLKTIIEAKGQCVVDIGHNGMDAISLFRKYVPDVLLMDIRMAQMNGVEASESILKEFPNARILFLTTFDDDEYIMKALKLGV